MNFVKILIEKRVWCLTEDLNGKVELVGDEVIDNYRVADVSEVGIIFRKKVCRKHVDNSLTLFCFLRKFSQIHIERQEFK